MQENKRAQELLNKVRAVIEAKGGSLERGSKNDSEVMSDYVLPAIDNSKDIQRHLYHQFYLSDNGVLRKIKNKIIQKIANVTRNTVEKSIMRQQKFNDNAALLLTYLFRENQELHERIKKLEPDKKEGSHGK